MDKNMTSKRGFAVGRSDPGSTFGSTPKWVSMLIREYQDPRLPSWMEEFAEKITQLDTRTMRHSYVIEKLEADNEFFKEHIRSERKEHEYPVFLDEDFGKILENLKSLEIASGDKSQILYYVMEIEALLGKLEEKGGATNHKYESRLAATLRDICRIHEPVDLSGKQIECFSGAVKSLINGWGKLDRKKTNWVYERLLEMGLTWLPVTEKAEKDIEKARKQL